MPRVFRKSYTKAIPADAERVTMTVRKRGVALDVPAVRFRDAGGKLVTAPLTADGKRCRLTSPTWYGKLAGDAVPLCANKAAAEVMLADLVRKASQAKAGLTNPFEAQESRTLADHLADYRVELESSGNAPRYVALVVSRLEAAFAGCAFALLKDLDADRVASWLAGLRKGGPEPRPLPSGQNEFTLAEAARLIGVKPALVAPLVTRHGLAGTGQGKARRLPRETVEALRRLRAGGVSVATTNAYLSQVRSFAGWLVRGRKLPRDPFAHLAGGNAEADKRHARRELAEAELRHLLATTKASARSFRGCRVRAATTCTRSRAAPASAPRRWRA